VSGWEIASFLARVFTFRELPKFARFHKTLVSDSVSKAKRLKLTHRIAHNHLLYRLLQTEHIDDEKETDVAKWYIKTERKKLRDYPEHLSVCEILKPSSVIKKMFKIHKLDGYRKILNIWLYDALSTSFMEESLSKSEVIIVYEHVIKLFEAMWLISQHISTNTLNL
jgi:hypothetical protein